MIDETEPKESVLGILRAAINIEKFGIMYYSALSSAVENERGKILLNHLVDEEEKHQRTLEQEYDNQKQAGIDALKPLPLDNLDEDGRLAIFSESLDNVDPKAIGAVEAVKIGLNMEQRSVKFYKSAAKLVSDPALKETLSNLVEFEKEHVELFKKNLEQLEREDTWLGYLPTT